jgi:hypothetical protein
MTAHGMICHLSDGVRPSMGERPVPAVKVPVPRALMKWGALWMPLQWPHGLKTAPELDQHAGGTASSGIRAGCGGATGTDDAICGATGEIPYGAASAFGVLTPREWLRLGYLHADHHLRQVGD